MRNEAPYLRSTRDQRFWLIAGLIFALAVALRWISLDLMMFRLDQAEVAFRAMEMKRGVRPFAGIVNSLGFFNAPGYVWSLLPAFVVNPDPRWVTGWHGLLTATMVFPLALIGRRYRSDACMWLPAIFAAVFPPVVFGGRELWAQHLLAPCAAWALLFFVSATDEQRTENHRAAMAAACLTVLAWALSIHFSAALPLIITAAVLWRSLKFKPFKRLWSLLPLLVILLTLVPSGLDWWENRTTDRPMPDYAAQMQSILPDPFPWWAKVSEAATASVSIDSMCGSLAHADLLSGTTAVLDSGFNGLATLAMVCGIILTVMQVFRRSTDLRAGFLPRKLTTLILAWLAAQILVAGLALTWVQPSYFEVIMPAIWLLLLLFPHSASKPVASARVRWSAIYRVATVVLLTMGTFLCLNLVKSISARYVVPGSYYIPYALQLRTVRYAQDHGVAAGDFRHMSGQAFERPYAYILRWSAGPKRQIPLPDQAGAAPPTGVVAIAEDSRFLDQEPTRAKLIALKNPVTIGTVKMVLLPNRGAADIFEREFERAGRN